MNLLRVLNEITWGLNLSKRIGFAFVISLIVATVIAPFIIKCLKKYKLEQVFRNQNEVHNLAQLHSSKAHTPTMGGIIIAIAMSCGMILVAHWNFQTILVFSTYLVIAIMGFIDDLLKIRVQNARGIPGRTKLLIQLFLTLIVAGIIRHHADLYEQYCSPSIPFFRPILTIPSFLIFVTFLFLVLAGTSNAVNLTDGLDGLATGCAIPVLFFLGTISIITGSRALSALWGCLYLPGNEELAILCASTLGALVAFFLHNGYPASIFMGDTGSLSLGILIGMVAFLTNHPFHLVIAGGIFVLEALSDILQVFSFKCFNGRRIFKMAPIHHHFELSGIHEAKITRSFTIISFLLSCLGFIATLR